MDMPDYQQFFRELRGPFGGPFDAALFERAFGA